jgi:hypothetical protein
MREGPYLSFVRLLLCLLPRGSWLGVGGLVLFVYSFVYSLGVDSGVALCLGHVVGACQTTVVVRNKMCLC